MTAPKGRRILMAAERVSPNGGTGSHTAASVAALREAGAEVLLALGEPAAGPAPTEAHVIPGLGAKAAPVPAFAELGDLIARFEPELVHIQQLPDARFIAAARRQAPVVYNVHNHLGCSSGWRYFRKPGQECRRAHGPGCIPNLILRGCAHSRDPRGLPGQYRRTTGMLAGLRAADAVVAHSRFVLEGLRRNEVERAVAAPLFVASDFKPSPPPEAGPIAFAGRVTEGKGVGTFLRAAARVEAPIEIVGDGWWAPKARRLAAKLGIEDRLSFRGWLGPEELARAYARARIVVVPSHWPEPFGLVGLEAMAAGRPVVGAATGGIPEWLEDGANGLLVAPGDPDAMADALAALLADPDRAARMGACGARRVRAEFTAERYLDAVGTAYDLASARWRTP